MQILFLQEDVRKRPLGCHPLFSSLVNHGGLSVCVGRQLREGQGRGPSEGDTQGLLNLDKACMRPEPEGKG